MQEIIFVFSAKFFYTSINTQWHICIFSKIKRARTHTHTPSKVKFFHWHGVLVLMFHTGCISAQTVLRLIPEPKKYAFAHTLTHAHTYMNTHTHTHRVHCVPGASGGKMRATKRLIRLTSISHWDSHTHTLWFPRFFSPTLLFTSYPLLAVPFAWVSSRTYFFCHVFIPSISKATSLRTLP